MLGWRGGRRSCSRREVFSPAWTSSRDRSSRRRLGDSCLAMRRATSRLARSRAGADRRRSTVNPGSRIWCSTSHPVARSTSWEAESSAVHARSRNHPETRRARCLDRTRDAVLETDVDLMHLTRPRGDIAGPLALVYAQLPSDLGDDEGRCVAATAANVPRNRTVPSCTP